MKREAALDQARLLAEALPFMQRYENKTIVVKYGGAAMGDPALAQAFARDIALLKQSGVNPVVVHGGGPQIGEMLKKLGIKSEFRGGLRVTDRATVEIVEMVLAGSINKEIVALINKEGEWAIGLSGKDGNMVFAEKATRTTVRSGFQDRGGDRSRLCRRAGRGRSHAARSPCPLGDDPRHRTGGAGPRRRDLQHQRRYVRRRDRGALSATRLLFLTDVPGVLDKSKSLIDELTVAEAKALIADGTISGGMIPKVETCIYAVERGVEGVVILDGKTPHAVLLELFTAHGAGTLIKG